MQHLSKGGAVIRLHMVHDHIIQLPLSQQMLQIFQEYVADGLVHRIQQHGFFVHQQVRIIGHTPGDGVDVFK